MIELVLVDFDDTLVDTSPRFQNARRELFRLLTDAGFEEADARRVHHDDVEPGMRAHYGLGPVRLPHSFRATYHALCQAAGQIIDEAVAERAAAIGHSVPGTPPLFDGALDALTRLARALPTVVYTQSGDPAYQRSCIEACGVSDVVSPARVQICGLKSTEQFRRLLADFAVSDASQAWMIGNSMRSDINPALEAGANAILVESADPWEYDLVEPFADSYHTVGSFRDAVDFLLNLEMACK